MIRHLSSVVAAALALSLPGPIPACAQMIDTARPEFMTGQFAVAAAASPARDRGVAAVARGDVQRAIEQAVCARIGCAWVAAALRIAKIESGFRCNARNGRAVGVFQNTDPARFGVSRSAALTCSGGVAAGVAHMAMCVRLGAHDAVSMMRCHNSGSPRGRLDRNYQRLLARR